MHTSGLNTHINNEVTAWPTALEYFPTQERHEFTVFHDFRSFAPLSPIRIYVRSSGPAMHIGIGIGSFTAFGPYAQTRCPEEVNRDFTKKHSDRIRIRFVNCHDGKIVAQSELQLSASDSDLLDAILRKQADLEKESTPGDILAFMMDDEIIHDLASYSVIIPLSEETAIAPQLSDSDKH